jgi:hypothetical protein
MFHGNPVEVLCIFTNVMPSIKKKLFFGAKSLFFDDQKFYNSILKFTLFKCPQSWKFQGTDNFRLYMIRKFCADDEKNLIFENNVMKAEF